MCHPSTGPHSNRLVGELTYADTMSPKPNVMGGMETNPAVGTPVGYGQTYNKTRVWADHATLCTNLSSHSSFKGINIHDWAGWEVMSPAVTNTADPGCPATPTPTPTPSPTPPPVTTVTFIGNAAEDGYVIESTATSNVGGAVTTSGYNVRAGDDNTNKCVKGFLSFDTSSLPDSITVTSVKLIMTSKAFTGDPYGAFGGLKVDIAAPYFGTGNSLISADYQATASVTNVVTLAQPTTTNQTQTTTLPSSTYTVVNRTGRTQFRLGFTTQDNGDSLHTRIDFWSGDSTDSGIQAYRPKLEIKYY
ncbi:hypothetical protein BH09SUM1_BH09SUM1_11400 [soil metagenome]